MEAADGTIWGIIVNDELLPPTETLEKMNNTGFGENDVCEITASGERDRMTKKVVALVSLYLFLFAVFGFNTDRIRCHSSNTNKHCAKYRYDNQPGILPI